MQKQNLFRFGLLTLILAASLIALHSFSTPAPKNDACCQETCPKKPREADGMIWESLSRQFFSAVTLP